MFTLGLLAMLIATAILAIHLDNAYGELWGGLVAIFVAPLIGAWLVRARVNKRDRQ
jgi:multisubunit Na+/H+ antiporter MnhG subunit